MFKYEHQNNNSDFSPKKIAEVLEHGLGWKGDFSLSITPTRLIVRGFVVRGSEFFVMSCAHDSWMHRAAWREALNGELISEFRFAGVVFKGNLVLPGQYPGEVDLWEEARSFPLSLKGA